mgnify:CR=1 FL=1
MSWSQISTAINTLLELKEKAEKWAAWRKIAQWLSFSIFSIFLIIHLAVRFYIWPQVEGHKTYFEQAISQNVGAVVKIGEIKTSWSALWPSFTIKNISITDKSSSQKELLHIPEVSGRLAWESIWHLKPYFHNLNFENATIEVKRDQEGNWDVAGIKLLKNSAGYTFGNWLFDQDNVNVTNAKIVWLDQLKQSSSYAITINSLQLNNSWLTHQIKLSEDSPWHEKTATIQANFKHNLLGNAGNWEDWSGKLEWHVEGIDLKKVSQVFDSPIKIIDGQISIVGNTYLNNGILDGGETTLLGQNLHFDWERFNKPLKIQSIESRLEQSTQGSTMTLNAPLLKWRANNQSTPQELNDISLYWKIAPNIESVKSVGIKAAHIDIELFEQLAKQFPLPKDLNEFIRQYQAAGELEDVDASWNAETHKLPFDIQIPGFNQSHYNLSLKFDHLFLTPFNKGELAVANIKGNLNASEIGGEVKLNSSSSVITLPKMLENDVLELNQANGSIKWKKEDGAWAYELNGVHLDNADASVNFDAAYRPKHGNSPEKIKIKGDIKRAKLQNITRYFPIAMSADARKYINQSLLDGEVNDGTIHIEGNPEQIPFNTKHPGIFNLDLPVVNANYLPAKEISQTGGKWSPFSHVTGLVVFNGAHLELDIKEATYESVQLRKIKGYVADIVSHNATITIEGQAEGLAKDLLTYYANSPSGKKVTDNWEKIKPEGQAKLNLKLEIPLQNVDQSKIHGEISLSKNSVNINNQIDIKDISGDILFSEEKILAKNLKAQALGGTITITTPSQLPWQSQNDMRVIGNAKIDALTELLNDGNKDSLGFALAKQFEGQVNYDGKLSITNNGYKINLGLQLNDLASQLPAPLNKKSGSSMNGQLLMENISTNGKTEHVGTVKIEKLLETKFAYKAPSSSRISLGINAPANLPTQGFSATIVLEKLDLEAWQNWSDKNLPDSSTSAPKKSSGTQLNTLSASIGSLKIADKELKNITLSATHDQDIWHASINSSLAVGLIQWKSPQAGLPQGKLTAKLQKLIIDSEASDDTITKSINQRIQKIPALDIQSEQTIINDKPYGKMELLASNDKNDWKIEKLNLKTADAKLTAHGKWILPHQDKQISPGRTELIFDLDIDNAGALLNNLGFPKTIEDGSGKLVGTIHWVGAPYKFDIKSLKGDMSLDLAKGTVLQVEPGIARLLGVLSFQGLSRIATLDISGVLKPVVSQGTPFDRITSKGTINNGIAQIQDLSMKGPQGNVRLTGQANLINETQDIRVTVVPNLNAGSASLAYTFVNPIIGLSTLVGQYLIADEVSKLFQLDYLIQGTWATPQIIALDSKGKPINESQLKEIRDKSLLRQQQNPNKQ